MDKGELIRFKVENEKFTDQTPVAPTSGQKADATPTGQLEEEAATTPEIHQDPPYQINVSFRRFFPPPWYMDI